MDQPIKCQFVRMEDGTAICHLHDILLVKQPIESTDDPPEDLSLWFCEKGAIMVFRTPFLSHAQVEPLLNGRRIPGYYAGSATRRQPLSGVGEQVEEEALGALQIIRHDPMLQVVIKALMRAFHLLPCSDQFPRSVLDEGGFKLNRCLSQIVH